jgi:hypothetical protein
VLGLIVWRAAKGRTRRTAVLKAFLFTRPALLLGHMQAGTYHIHVTQATLYEKTWTWSNGGSPVDLTGYHAKLKTQADGVQVMALTDVLDGTGNGLTIGGSDGTVSIVLKTAKSQAFTFTRGNYELQLTRPDGEDIPFLEGGFYVESEFIDD